MSVYPKGADVERDAVLSPDGVYRYLLTRWWGGMTDDDRAMTFIMLNPSTADAEVDDPTIGRCVGFARQHGFQGPVHQSRHTPEPMEARMTESIVNKSDVAMTHVTTALTHTTAALDAVVKTQRALVLALLMLTVSNAGMVTMLLLHARR